MSIRWLIFDLDGTLIDTEPSAARAIDSSMRSWGVQVTPEDSRYIAGRTWGMAFEYLTSKYTLPVSTAQAEAVILDAYRRDIQTALVEVPGARDAVHALAGEYRLALVSGSGRAEIAFALDRLGVTQRFEFYLGAEDYPRSKPAPDGYLKALQMLGADPAQSVVFEDSQPGIASALAAGMRVVAISSTNHFGHDQSGAAFTIEDLRGIDPKWMKSRFSGA